MKVKKRDIRQARRDKEQMRMMAWHNDNDKSIKQARTSKQEKDYGKRKN